MNYHEQETQLLSDVLLGEQKPRVERVARVHMTQAQPRYRRTLRPWVVVLAWVIALACPAWVMFQLVGYFVGEMTR